MLDKLKKNMDKTRTENNAVAHTTTHSKLLDFFSQAGAMRTRTSEDQYAMFNAAYADDPELATKMLFYFRDIRGGQGERDLFRNIIHQLAKDETETVKKNIGLFEKYGRWDDYYALIDTPLEDEMFSYLQKQFIEDSIEENKPSLLAKWLPSENASSDRTEELAHKTMEAFGLSPRQYRKALTELRKEIGVVEQKMSANEWEDINYERVPSRASMIYRNAFQEHDPDGYEEYLQAVEKGEAKINATTLYPYDIVNKVLNKGESGKTLNEQWKALPDYIGDREENSIAVVDTSGSMNGHPITVSVGLGLYLAERAKGPYKDHFITFSANPTLQEVKGTNIVQKIRNLYKAEWDMNTDIEAVFDTILQTALEHGIDQDEMLDKLYIISDMEFDSATSSYSGWSRRESVPKPTKSLFEKIEKKYKDNGYEMPNLVFWNVNARQKQFPTTKHNSGAQLVSGSSPSIFKQLMNDKFLTPEELMIQTITDERYDEVTV